MKYFVFSLWLIISLIMCILIFPAMVADIVGWFEIGEKILNSDVNQGGNNEQQ